MKKLLLPAALLALCTTAALARPGHPDAEKAAHASSVLLPTVTIEAPAWARHPAPHHTAAHAPQHPRRQAGSR